MNRKFEAKVYGSFWLIIILAVVLGTLYQTHALARNLPRLLVAISIKVPSIIIIGGIAQFFLFRICWSIKKELKELSSSLAAPVSKVIVVHKKIKAIERVFILVNTLGFLIAPIATLLIYAFIGRPYPPFESLFLILTHVFIGLASIFLQISLLHIIFQDILSSFRMYHLIPALHDIPVLRKRMVSFMTQILLPMSLLGGFLYGIANAVTQGTLDLSEGYGFIFAEFFVHCCAYVICLYLIQYVLAKEEQNKLHQLRDSIRSNLQAGNSDAVMISIISHDDYGDVASVVNEYTERLMRLIDNITLASRTVGETSSDLQSSIMRSEKSLEMMQNINAGISNVVVEEARAVERASQAIDAIYGSVSKVDTAVTEQASYVEESSAAVTEMGANIQSVVKIAQKAEEETETLNRGIGDGSKCLADSLAAIHKMREASKQVQTTVDLIEDMAAQTNLLAMNAAIEASHAGEAGRGFGVVATEIRKLAEESSRRAKDIGTVIRGMVMSIDTGVESSGKTDQAFSQIRTAVQSTSQVINMVNSAMQEQQKAADEIRISMDSLVNATHAIKDEVAKQTENSDEMKNSFNILVSAMKNLEEQTRRQQEEDSMLGEVIGNLHVVNKKNSEAVTNLVIAAGKSA